MFQPSKYNFIKRNTLLELKKEEKKNEIPLKLEKGRREKEIKQDYKAATNNTTNIERKQKQKKKTLNCDHCAAPSNCVCGLRRLSLVSSL